MSKPYAVRRPGAHGSAGLPVRPVVSRPRPDGRLTSIRSWRLD
ncbi:hypothetical protein ACI2K4_08970 [Micromonospora sp. NPDC050397]